MTNTSNGPGSKLPEGYTLLGQNTVEDDLNPYVTAIEGGNGAKTSVAHEVKKGLLERVAEYFRSLTGGQSR